MRIGSIGYGSVDAGHLGYADETCGPGEHCIFTRSTIMEILDEETGEVIEETGRPGKLIFTNLTRMFMPIIRYPVGDRGVWAENVGAHDRKMKLLGRAEDGARLGNVTIGRQDVADVVVKYRRLLGISNFQIIIDHVDTKDCLIINFASAKPNCEVEGYSDAIVEDFYVAKPGFKQMVDEKRIHPIVIKWIAVDDLERNPRTGKLRIFNDRRSEVLAQGPVA